jgi:SAM-dependent methyltransferase
VKAVRSAGRSLGRDLTRGETVSWLALLSRLAWYCLVRRRLRTLESEEAFPVTVRHNLRSLVRKLDRMLLLVDPLSVLEHVPKDARILVIGPRNEWDLLLLHMRGFDFGRCTGLDLISYSPRIVLGDMHAMPFGDGEFDVVLCGWTISYSANPALACREIARVCRPGGTIGIAVEYSDGDQDAERRATGGYLIQDERLQERVNSVPQILALFPERGQVYFNHDAPLRRAWAPGVLPSNCAVVFERAA